LLEEYPMSEGETQVAENRIEMRLDSIENRLSRLEGLFEQMDRRVSGLEQLQRQGLGIMMGTWVSLMMAVLGLYFRG
jgi:hypothetical protein